MAWLLTILRRLIWEQDALVKHWRLKAERLVKSLIIQGSD